MVIDFSAGSSDNVWRDAILNSDVTIEQVIRNLDQVAIRLVMIVNDDGELLGTISDGDVRRALLRGLNMASPIESVIHRTPLVVPEAMKHELVLQLMTANKVQQIPVIDEQRRVVGLHLWDEINTVRDRSNSMVIMAGGLGTRLRPRTERCPKPLLQVGGRPMLEHIIDRAKDEGFRHFILALGYLGHMIEDHFGDGSRWQVRIEYLREKTPLGTAGAIGLMRAKPELPFIVTNGDVLTDVRYSQMLDFHTRHDAVATMAVRVHEWQHPYGVVQTHGLDIVGFEEKPIARTHINAGVYVLDPIVLQELGINDRCDMPSLFGRLHSKGMRTLAFPMHEPWLDVGRPADLEQAERGAVVKFDRAVA